MPLAKLPAAYGPALWQAITKHLYIKTKQKKADAFIHRQPPFIQKSEEKKGPLIGGRN